MVRGLIQDQQVDRHGQGFGERQACLFPTGEVSHQPVHRIAPESERCEVGAGIATVRSYPWNGPELVDHGPLFVEHLGLELVEVREVHVGSP